MDTATRPAPLPALFVSHGSPMLAIEPGATGAFFSHLGPAIDATFGRPRAIVVVSPHTAAPQPVLLDSAAHHAVHDFGGFPDALYALRYAPPGEPAVAARVMELLTAAGLQPQRSPEAGLDHGIWGQFATGITAIGQLAAGQYVLAQLGFGQHLWTPDRADPLAVQHFQALWDAIRDFGSKR